MLLQLSASMLLALAIALSWPRFILIFRTSENAAEPVSSVTMAATATSISATGLAFSSNPPWHGMVILALGMLLGIGIRTPASAIAVALSVVSLATYLELHSMFA
jgi:hypothetical protein